MFGDLHTFLKTLGLLSAEPSRRVEDRLHQSPGWEEAPSEKSPAVNELGTKPREHCKRPLAQTCVLRVGCYPYDYVKCLEEPVMAPQSSSDKSGGFTDGPGPAAFRHQKLLLDKHRWASLPTPSRARGQQRGWPSADLASGPGSDTNPPYILRQIPQLSGLGFPICNIWQLHQTISKSFHSNTAQRFVSLGPLRTVCLLKQLFPQL